jgi:nucleoside-diphosphate-sugar epimerase
LGTPARRDRDQYTNGESSGSSSRGNSDNKIDSKNKKGHVALIAGVTGMVGSRLAEILPRDGIAGGPWKVYGVARRPITPQHHKNIQYIECDVVDRDQTMEKISVLTDVTHLFWVITNTGRGAEQDCKMLANVLDSLIPNAPNLEHVCVQTGSEHYLGSHDFSAMDMITHPDEAPFHERLPRLNNGSNLSYYKLEDVLSAKLGQSDIKISWSIHRPAVILLGFSPFSESSMNLLVSLAVYAAICKKEGSQFRFPGNSVTWEGLTDASDSELIAEQQIWACVEANGKNQTFNVTNGDVFRWKSLWMVLAEKLEVEPGDYDGRGFSMAEEMKNKSSVWEQIVKEKGLLESRLEQLGEQWWSSVDRILNRNMKNGVSSTNKSKEYGFVGFRNTESSCLEWIDMLKNHKIIP